MPSSSSWSTSSSIFNAVGRESTTRGGVSRVRALDCAILTLRRRRFEGARFVFAGVRVARLLPRFGVSGSRGRSTMGARARA